MNPESPKPPLKVLVLEDCDEDMFFLERKLNTSRYQPEFKRVWTEADTRDALLSRAWDIIISDGSLLGFDGLRALALVKEMGLNTPFILLSGMISAERAEAARKAGAFDCIPKNDLDRLLASIERALGHVGNSARPCHQKSPPTGEPVLVQCDGFRCLAYLDPEGKWREYKNSKELPDVIEWFEI
jgi:DNA-binding NtrC family response regulator